MRKTPAVVTMAAEQPWSVEWWIDGLDGATSDGSLLVIALSILRKTGFAFICGCQADGAAGPAAAASRCCDADIILSQCVRHFDPRPKNTTSSSRARSILNCRYDDPIFSAMLSQKSSRPNLSPYICLKRINNLRTFHSLYFLSRFK